MSKLLALLLAAFLTQTDKPMSTEKDSGEEPVDFKRLLDESKNMGPWEDNAKLEAQALSNVFVRNGWNSEEDRFAQNVAMRVGQIPPWEFQERQNVFLSTVGERYGMNADQKRKLNAMMQRESLRFTLNHFSEVAPIAMEAMKARGSGEPFTAEQIARWSKALRPIAEEARESVERVSRELGKNMDEKQREILNRDTKAILKRHKKITSQMQKWENGEWKAEEWGMENDPIQSGQRRDGAKPVDPELAALKARAMEEKLRAEAAGSTNAGKGGEPTAAGPLVSENEWERYVREFAAAHKFSEGQNKSALGVLKDLQGRAKSWRTANGRKIDELRTQTAAAKNPTEQARLATELEKLQSPIRDMFEELKKRLDALLTVQQRGSGK